MPEQENEKVIITQKGILIRDNKVLILEYAKHPGLWGLPGGRIDIGESCQEAFARELKEELGFKKFDNLGVVDHDIWVTPKGVSVCVISMVIVNNNDNITISSEHLKMKWVSREEVADYKYFFPGLKRMIEKGFACKKLNNKNTGN